MGYDCPCGTSVGRRAHWCEWKQEQHARRLEALNHLLVSAVSALVEDPAFRAELVRESERIARQAEDEA